MQAQDFAALPSPAGDQCGLLRQCEPAVVEVSGSNCGVRPAPILLKLKFV
jgi:hypothetical protein